VAKIPPSKGADTAKLNEAIGAWAATKTTPTSPVTVVDCYTGFSAASDTRDGVHFNDKGDKKVGACFAPEIARIIKEGGGEGGAAPPAAKGLPKGKGLGGR
jgi:lysophospholipase L1-like esterase